MFRTFRLAAPFTKYRLSVRAFTKRREGPSSEPLIIITDTEPPSSPRITNISCYGRLLKRELGALWDLGARRPHYSSSRPGFESRLRSFFSEITVSNDSVHSLELQDSAKGLIKSLLIVYRTFKSLVRAVLQKRIGETFQCFNRNPVP